jgi:hypothetical protein
VREWNAERIRYNEYERPPVTRFFRAPLRPKNNS